MINIAIIEDDILVRDTLVDFFFQEADIECVLAAGSIPEFLERVGDQPPLDVILMDIGLPGMTGIEGIPLVKKKFPDVSVIMLSVYADNDRIFKALCAGAIGYLQKDTPLPEVRNSVKLVYNGGSAMSPAIARKVVEYFTPKKSYNSPLTAKEQQVVMAMVDGLSYKMIADRLSVSLETVRQHIKNIYRKLHVNSKAEVIARSIRGEI